MKILFLGGTAFFGKEIVRALIDAGHDVTIFTRGHATPEELRPLPQLKGDRSNLADLKKAAAHAAWDAVIDHIAYTGEHVKQALSAFPDIKRYVLTSTISVYRYAAKPVTQPLHEWFVDYDYHPPEEDLNDIHWQYAYGKLEAERACVRQDRVPWTILRPTMVYGPFDTKCRGFWYLARLLKGGPLLMPDGGAAAFRLLYSHDAAQCYLPALEEERAIGRIYNLAQPEIITLKEFIEHSAVAMGVDPVTVSVPSELLGEMGGPLALNQSWIPSLEAARRDLKLKPTPIDDFLSSTACWFRDLWTGDEKELLKTRDQELEFARQWAKATSAFSTPRR